MSLAYQPVVIDPMRPSPQPGLPKLDDILKASATVGRMPVQWLSSRDKTHAVSVARWAYYSVARDMGFTPREIVKRVNRSRHSLLHGLTIGQFRNPNYATHRALLVALLKTKFPYMRGDDTE